MKSGRPFDVDSYRKNPWTIAFKRARISYQRPYVLRHTFAAWALTAGIDKNRLVSLMGHTSKEMVYEIYGKYVEDLEKDKHEILKSLVEAAGVEPVFPHDWRGFGGRWSTCGRQWPTRLVIGFEKSNWVRI